MIFSPKIARIQQLVKYLIYIVKEDKTGTKCYNQMTRPYKDLLWFKNIKESQLVTTTATGPSYSKSYHWDQTELLYKLLKCDAKLVRTVLETNGFRYTESHDWNVLWMTSSANSYVYEGLNEYQKVNHFPWSYEITRKDSLCTNIVDMQEKFGHAPFNIIPDSYVIPDEYSDFYVHYNELKKEAPYKNLWIWKPWSSSQGKGIFITEDIHDIDRTDKCVVSRYIHNPLLINSHKFDLRIYVLITSFEPLRIYVYQEGLTRFASEPYSSGTKFNKFSHLTNYSINKKNINFVQNKDLEHDDYGFKWSLSALWGHLEQIGIDMDLLWSKIYDLIIKSIIAAEDKIMAGIAKHWTHKTNWFEVLGFDVLIDSELKPWLLEANLSPSLSSDSPLDFKIKSSLITDALNVVGIKKYDRRKESVNKIKHRMKGLYARGKSMNNRYGNNNFSYSYKDTSRHSMKSFLQPSNAKDIETELVRYLQTDRSLAEYKNIVKSLIPIKFKDLLRQCLLENSNRGNFIRIYPAENTNIYDKYFKSVRPYNVFLYKCFYGDEIIPQELSNSDTTMQPTWYSSSNLQSPKDSSFSMQNYGKKKQKMTRPQTVKVGSSSNMRSNESNEKIIITGDDVLIEYVQRL